MASHRWAYIPAFSRRIREDTLKGTRPLDNDEIRRVSTCFTGTYEARNRGLFMLGVSTGGRISELLSLTIGDVYQNGSAVSDLLFEKSVVKGGEVSRAVPVNADGRRAIDDLIAWHREKYQRIKPSRPLFPSRNRSGNHQDRITSGKRKDLMSTQHEMRLPFTTKKEILDWEAYYKESQNRTRQELEASVIGFRKKVSERQTNETPGGYLCHSELREMARWKDRFVPSKIDENSPERIKEVTSEALGLDFGLDNDWEKLKKLIRVYGGLYGVGAPVASVILHLYDRGDYPLIDKHALCSIGINYRKVNYDECFWREYTNFCRAEAERYKVSMRTLDRALYKFSKADAAAILKIMPDEMLFLEIKRRGYDIASVPLDNQTTA